MICRYVIYFSIFSVIGYLYESLAMTIWGGKWENRGFLFGPAIPIYGAGALFGTLLFHYIYTDYTPMSVFFISMFASAVREYVVHYLLEQIFHAYWWDYSTAPFNINGRICLPATIGFGIAGLIIIYVLNPIVIPLIEKIGDVWVQLLALLLVSLFAADTTLTVCVISNFIRRVERFDSAVNEHMDSFFGNFLDESKAVNSKFYSAVDKIEEKRKRIIDIRIERAIDAMSDVYRRIILRIRGFRGNIHAPRLNEILGRIRRRISRKKDE